MKKFTSILTLLLAIGGVTASAQETATWKKVASYDESAAYTSVDQLTDGQTIVFKHASTSEYLYVNPITNVLWISNETSPSADSDLSGLMVFTVHTHAAEDGTTTYSFESALAGNYIPVVNYDGQPDLVVSETEATFTVSTTNTAGTALDEGSFVITSVESYDGTNYGSFDGATDTHKFVGWQGTGSNCAYQIIPVTTSEDTYTYTIPSSTGLTFSDSQQISLGDAATELVTGQWYVMYNVNRPSYVTNESGTLMMRESPDGSIASSAVNYLFRLDASTTEGYYNIYSASGNSYLSISQGGASTVDLSKVIQGISENATAPDFTIATIGDNAGYFYMQQLSNSIIADGNGSGSTFVGWGTSIPTAITGNNTYQFFPVSFVNLTADAIKNQYPYPVFLTESEEYNNAADAWAADPTDENAQAVFEAAKNAVNGKYFQISNYAGRGYLNASGSAVGLTAEASASADASTFWTMEATDDLNFKFYNVNTKSYFGTLANASSDSSTPPTLAATSDEAPYFTITARSAGGYILQQNGSSRMNAETSGIVNYWNANADQTSWNIAEATSIDIALTAIGDYGYAAVYLPFGVETTDATRLFTATASDEEGTLTLNPNERTTVPAETGVIVVGATGATTATLALTDEAIAVDENSLTGSLAAVTEDVSTYLVLSNSDGSLVFDYNQATEIAANTAFVDGTAVGATGTAIPVDMYAITGIEKATTVDLSTDNAPVYDLSGRRVLKAVKGNLYIQKGNKFIAK